MCSMRPLHVLLIQKMFMSDADGHHVPKNNFSSNILFPVPNLQTQKLLKSLKTTISTSCPRVSESPAVHVHKNMFSCSFFWNNSCPLVPDNYSARFINLKLCPVKQRTTTETVSMENQRFEPNVMRHVQSCYCRHNKLTWLHNNRIGHVVRPMLLQTLTDAAWKHSVSAVSKTFCPTSHKTVKKNLPWRWKEDYEKKKVNHLVTSTCWRLSSPDKILEFPSSCTKTWNSVLALQSLSGRDGSKKHHFIISEQITHHKSSYSLSSFSLFTYQTSPFLHNKSNYCFLWVIFELSTLRANFIINYVSTTIVIVSFKNQIFSVIKKAKAFL